jgi:hypothetical protein
VEPPREVVPPPRPGPSGPLGGRHDPHPDPEPGPEVGALRLIAAAAAVALVVASQGHLLLLGGLLVVVVATRAGAAAAPLAVTAAFVRWGDGSLSALGGDQAVLGPAFLVGDTRAAASAVLAGLAVALLAPRSVPLAAAVGVVAGALVAGPTLPHDLGVRVAGAIAGVLVALVARWVPFRGAAAVALGLLALAAAA